MITSLALKYASALADVAAQEQQEEPIGQELILFAQLLEEHSELQEILTSPAVSFSAKRRIIEQIGTEGELSRTMVNLLLVLLRNARIHLYGQVREAYREVLDRRSGISRGRVFAAHQLSESERERIEQATSQLVGGDVHLTFHRDESLIGGIKIQIGSTVFDGSVNTQLHEIRRRLAGEGTRV